MRIAKSVWVLFPIAALSAAAAAGAAVPSFDAASVRVAAPPDFASMRSGPPPMGVHYDSGRLDIKSMPLRDVIVAAYRIKTYQLEGPDWMRGVMVDISAKLPEGATDDQIPEMLQTLLADRFGLKVHHEKKDEPVYFLTVAKSGLKMKEAPQEEGKTAARPKDPKAPDFGMMGRMSNSTMSGDPMRGMVITGPGGDVTKVTMSGAGIHLEASKMDMATLTDQLTQFLDRPVIDKTNLAGSYDVTLDLSMGDMMNMMQKQGFPGGGGPPPGAGGGPGGFGPPGGFPGGGFPAASGDTSSTVMQSLQKLGLKLDPAKSPGDLLVIDQLEKAPTDN
ncbi:MAG TPA: TIGR03435 family protein [Bryobacteraceae bacterium]|nr:TIGR03435 family protein [Bryobacteraceae bacterium]